MAGDRAAVSSLVLKIPDIDARQATFENIPFVRRYRWHPLRVARQPPTFLLPHWRLRGTSELKFPACSIGCDARDPTWRSRTGSTEDSYLFALRYDLPPETPWPLQLGRDILEK